MRYLHFAFLALAAMAFSCDAPTTIGSALQPDELLVRTEYIDTFTLRFRSFQYDSVNTMTSTLMLAGHVEDPNFGKTTAQSFAQIALLGTTTSVKLLGDGATSEAALDSVRITLGLGYAFGDSARTNKRRIHIRTMTQNIDTAGNRRYYQFDKLTVGETIVDTMVQFGSQTVGLTLKPEQTFARRIFGHAAAGDISSLAKLNEIIKGISISSDAAGQSMYGFSTASSSIRFFYHYFKGADTIRTSFSLYPTGFRFVNIEADRTGTPLENIADVSLNSEDAANLGFVQAGASIGTRIVLPDLSAYSLANKVAINRAELWFTPLPGTYNVSTSPPASLYLLQSNAQGKPLTDASGAFIPLRSLGGSELIASYITGGQTYTPVDVTYYVEELANGRQANNGFVLHPSAQQSNSINYVRLTDSEHAGAFPMVLRIYYTRFQ